MKKRLITLFSLFLLLTNLTGCLFEYTNGSNSFLEPTRKATNSDIIVNFKLIPGIFSTDTYLLTLQAQEEITDLSLEIDFRSSSGTTLKTDNLYVGKVVPGNKYEFTLDQSGMRFEDLNTVKNFYVRVSSGKVKL